MLKVMPAFFLLMAVCFVQAGFTVGSREMDLDIKASVGTQATTLPRWMFY
jgi:hypothetical protein